MGGVGMIASFEAMRVWHNEALRSQHAAIRDALSGRSLDVLRQCVAIDVEGRGPRSAGVVDDGVSPPLADAGHAINVARIKDSRGLADALLSLHEARRDGAEAHGPAAVLLTAGPAAGKTSLLSQVAVHLLAREGVDSLVPIVVKIQLLQLRLREGGDAFAGAWNWVRARRVASCRLSHHGQLHLLPFQLPKSLSQ